MAPWLIRFGLLLLAVWVLLLMLVVFIGESLYTVIVHGRQELATYMGDVFDDVARTAREWWYRWREAGKQ